MSARKPREMEADLDMTTFINLMVVLLAFLLVTAVFTEVSMLQVNLPSNGGGGAAAQSAKPPLVLEVAIYSNHLLVDDRQSGPLKNIPAVDGKPDYKSLTEFLSQIKLKYPAITEITLLLEPGTNYDTLIHTMDSVRYRPEFVNGQVIKQALFPDIGIGDAPEDAKGGA